MYKNQVRIQMCRNYTPGLSPAKDPEHAGPYAQKWNTILLPVHRSAGKCAGNRNHFGQMKLQGSIGEREITEPAFSMHPELRGQVMETMRKRVGRVKEKCFAPRTQRTRVLIEFIYPVVKNPCAIPDLPAFSATQRATLPGSYLPSRLALKRISCH